MSECTCPICEGRYEEEEEGPVLRCAGCGEELYPGDDYYPDLELCEYCIGRFKVRIGSELI